jgi:RNA polymerase sigma-70 factor (ECF subfamily)
VPEQFLGEGVLVTAPPYPTGGSSCHSPKEEVYMVTHAVLPIVFLVVLIATAVSAQEAKKELDKFQGQWVGVSREERGKKMPDKFAMQYKLTIQGNRWTVKDGDGSENDVAIQIDPSKNPKTIDLTFKVDKERTYTFLGIYKLEGDTLTVCLRAAPRGRPKHFETTREGGNLEVWKRAKK